jgi:hypothetical protein
MQFYEVMHSIESGDRVFIIVAYCWGHTESKDFYFEDWVWLKILHTRTNPRPNPSNGHPLPITTGCWSVCSSNSCMGLDYWSFIAKCYKYQNIQINAWMNNNKAQVSAGTTQITRWYSNRFFWYEVNFDFFRHFHENWLFSNFLKTKNYMVLRLISSIVWSVSRHVVVPCCGKTWSFQSWVSNSRTCTHSRRGLLNIHDQQSYHWDFESN